MNRLAPTLDPKKCLRVLRYICFFASLALSAATLSSGQAKNEAKPAAEPRPAAGVATIAVVQPHELTAPDVEAFLGGLIPLQIARDDIGGAVVCVVKDGKILFAKGYGYADVKSKKPVSPSDTLFRPGSISKLFTWTSVMQLVEQGKLDLDRDVNDYLDFKIPATFAQPITLRDIMTHTSGFEETVKDLITSKVEGKTALADYLSTHIPKRMFAPGTVPAYSNYATGLAGYIVQRVSGEPYEDYVVKHIFEPLGMKHSSFKQPLPDDIKALMSSGYRRASQDAKPYELVQPAPAGSLATSAEDLARFMIAHLQDGQYEGAQILKPETARLMHARQRGLNANMNAMALGFYEESRNGHRIIGHGGDTIYFHSDLHLVADAHLGFFISQNSAGRGDASLRGMVWRAFLDRYFPYPPPAANPPASAKEDAKTVSGTYLTSRRADSTLLRIASSTTSVDAQPDSTIEVSDINELNGTPRKWQEIAPLLYRNVNGQERLAFQRDSSGRMMIVVDFPAVALQKVGWTESDSFVQAILFTSIVLLALALVLWAIAAILRRHYGRTLELSPSARRSRLIVRIWCGFSLAVVGAWAAIFLRAAQSDLGIFSKRLDPWLHLLQALDWICVIGTLAAIVHCVRMWKSQGTWWGTKVQETLVALAFLGFSWFLLVHNLLKFSVSY